MAKTKDPKTVQVLKAPSGDMMLVVPLDKAATAGLRGKKLWVEVLTDTPRLPRPKCLAFFKPFRFLRDEIVFLPGGVGPEVAGRPIARGK
jgi:hypothetical protein